MTETTDRDLPETDADHLAEAMRQVKTLRNEERALYEQAKAAVREGRSDDAHALLIDATVKADEANSRETYARDQWGSE